jgi:hypothetical protein
MEIQAQIAAFHACFGRPPDHLDGHLHVQQLPVICEEVAVAAAGLCRTAPCYVRHTWLPLTKLLREGGFKRAAIAIPAGRLRRSLLHAAVPTNSGFYGVYDYRRWQNFPVWFEGFRVAARRVNDIIMVHPGFVEPWRRLEYDTLNSASELRPNRFRHAAQA